MKSNLSSKESKYPYLGFKQTENGGEVVVLFYSPKQGTMIHCPECIYQPGYHQANWDEETFVRYEGQVVLEN